MLTRAATHEADEFSRAAVVELAPAKINLALHVVGQRPDGYHLLESVVTFADIGDRLALSPSAEDSFGLSGPFSASLRADAGNLVVRAREMLRSWLQEHGQDAPPVAIHLEKNLPVASGIGGGSADAAAVLKGLAQLWDDKITDREMAALALALGADVPMCFAGIPSLARGIGEDLLPLPDLPSLHLVLGNPLRSVSTPEIFARLACKQNPPIGNISGDGWISLLPHLRNDLQAPASALVPEIGDLSELIAGEGALLTRMSGSGATCFGIFSSRGAADEAAERLRALRPNWYFQPTTTISGAPA
ncbi:4-diphosphocytidyl-2-C-methyl-D-erythritol kinase [Pseudorhizobium tarimense]|uniref:4-diphosphocytidyl-2-C-methyl-D-erythritol kinase n=1 Tax=Pseudorhizobium tarimense TaxID=1079109 RepID=A0ABV2H1S9_9HYPH|nr:4-(cytidine 5'-diphospho)-2-C-methyl-D-erythritol kinase [Pseudorhizobium tarimense]MCJ8517593.1 4-(cytidine 5'-diphospho)-2-C-methyl-D-erythritol kinase [Pseudorhizobium tarimense]